VFDKTLNRFVNVYQKDGKEYYGYTKSEYFSPSYVTNFVTNGEEIIYTSGWMQE
jgi:hypothetical protein